MMAAMAKKQEAPDNLDEELNDLERRVDRLRVLYEQFFLGIEKRPPLGLQRDVFRLLRHIGNYQIRNTSHKFRYQSVIQRFNVHRAYWARTTREIEEGTYKRHRLRVQKREVARSGEPIDNAELAKRALLRNMRGDEAVEERRQRLGSGEHTAAESRRGPAVARKKRRPKKNIRGTPLNAVADTNKQIADALAVDGNVSQTVDSALDSVFGPTPSSIRHAAPPPVPRPAPPPVPKPPERSWSTVSAASTVLSKAGINEDRARSIYNDFVNARKERGETVEKLSFDRIVKSMAKQVPKVRKSNSAEVDFQVVTKDQKVFLKPVAKDK